MSLRWVDNKLLTDVSYEMNKKKCMQGFVGGGGTLRKEANAKT